MINDLSLLLDTNPMQKKNRCKDFDDDCPGVNDKVVCWLYNFERGWCPFIYNE